jgi:hypothetical protein
MYELLKIIRRKRRPLIDVDSQGDGICPPVNPSPVPEVSTPRCPSTDEKSDQQPGAPPAQQSRSVRVGEPDSARTRSK